jgi:hypothetical protein
MRAALGAAGQKNKASARTRQIQVRVREVLTIARQTRSFRRPPSDRVPKAGGGAPSSVLGT